MFDKQKMRDDIITKAQDIISKQPLIVSELSYFSIDIIMELDEMAKEGDERAIKLKEQIKQITTELKNKKSQTNM